MPRTWSVRLQTALVIGLFLGSLVTVLYSAGQTLLLPRREFQMRDRLHEASQRMADAAQPELRSLQEHEGRSFDALNDKLRAISNRVLADFPGVEGGFYLDVTLDRFAGYAFPTEPPDAAPTPSNSETGQAATGTGLTQPLPPRRGDEPPPRESPLILAQVKQSLGLAPGEFQFDARTVGPSRVAILTEAVGPDRPAHLATWTLFRLVSPESQQRQLHRYEIATGLALGGIALAVALTLNLGRTLRRQRLEQEQLRDELRRSEHLASLGKLLAGVAHEVRNPLAGIRSTVQLWERLPDTARTQGSLQAVIRAVDRLNEIVSRLLYFARMDNDERQPVSLNSLLIETLNLLDAQATGQSVTLERDLDPNLPGVCGSASALRQVFLNLATNALQAMSHGGRLRCSTRTEPQKGTVEVRFTDTGPGISPEVRQHLFEPFFTTRPDGTGLGLALCREIVLQHGGQITLESEGPGASFRVALPAAR
jgi:two-component system, NtrC family, sensor histidine kinase HydH